MCVYKCTNECLWVREVWGGVPTILFVLCPTLPASLFIALLCSFHTELMRKTHTLDTLLLAGTNTRRHTHTHTHTHRERIHAALLIPPQWPLRCRRNSSFPPLPKCQHLLLSLCLWDEPSWQQVSLHVSAHWLNTPKDAHTHTISPARHNY